MNIYKDILQAKRECKKKFAVLIDPDKMNVGNLEKTIKLSIDAHVDYFFIGGSLIVNDMMDRVLSTIRMACSIPTVLFPGNAFQINNQADAILFLSLISGRNPELLIGNHVLAAPMLKQSDLEVISTGYMLIDGGVATSVSYMSNTQPIPSTKPEIAQCTAMAGELLGLKCIYMDAGSGAKLPISTKIIKKVSSNIDIPLIIGGGIRGPEQARKAVEAGADLIVVGNAIEKDPNIIMDISAAVHAHVTTSVKQ